MFGKIRGFFMSILNLFHNHTIEQVTGIETHISAEMLDAIGLWNDMLAGNAPWNDKAKSCGTLSQVATVLSNYVTREIALEVENPAIESVMRHIDKNVDKTVEFIVLLGGCVIRPIYANGRLQYENIPLGNYLPIKYDFDGTLMSAIILKSLSEKNKKFVLVESHNFDGANHTVKCTLYRNESGALRKTTLSDCTLTAEITPEYTWRNVKRPMIIEFRNHATNKIDGSNIPVSLVAGTEDLVKDADEQYERMNWEQEGGEMRMIVDRDMFQKRRKRDGTETGTRMDKTLCRLMTMIDGDGSADGKKIIEHAPQLRTEAQNAMLQQIFRRIELTMGVGKGTISDMESVEQTAEQYRGGKMGLFAVVDKIEDEIEAKYHGCAEVFAHMAAAYRLGANNPKITVKWSDDQTRKDMQQAKQTAMQEITAGIKNKWEYRRDFFGEDEETAKANTPPEPSAPDFGFMGA